MKGMVFTEFLEMVEAAYGISTVDKIIELSQLPSGGAYTAVGTYEHGEMVTLVGNLSHITGVPISGLLKIYGKHLFGRLYASYGHFFSGVNDCFDFLEKIEGYIHKEVLKLYPDAELPHFSHHRRSHDELELIYRSPRQMGDFAEGLIEGCANHFKEDIFVEKQQVLPGDGSVVRFLIRRRVAGAHHG